MRNAIFFLLLLGSLTFASAQNLMSNWNGGGATGTGSEPNNFGWDCTLITGWAQANVFGVRFQDNVSYTYNGGTLAGRVLYTRWDGTASTNTTSIYSYPATLDACKTYTFTAKAAWHSNGSAPTYSFQINTAKNNSGTSLAAGQITCSTAQQLQDISMQFTTSDAGTYYFTFGSNTAVLGAIRDLSLVEASGAQNLSVSETSLSFDHLNLMSEVTIAGGGLTEDVTISTPSGISASPSTISASEAQCGVAVQFTFDDQTSIKSGIITISSSGNTKNITVNSFVGDASCYMPLYAGVTNIIVDPLLNDIANFGGWGTKSITTDASLVYCGENAGLISGGSLDVVLTGKISPNTAYRVKAMVKAASTSARIGVYGWNDAAADINTYATVVDDWAPIDFVFTTGATLRASGHGLFFNNASGSAIDNWELYAIPANETNLYALAVSEGLLTPAYSHEVNEYSVLLNPGTASVTPSLTTIDPKAVATGLGAVDVSSGSGSSNIVITGRDGQTTRNIAINYTVSNQSFDATLKSLTVSEGEFSQPFDASVTNYQVKYFKGISSINISAESNDAAATVSGDLGDFSVADGAVANITVTAEDGTTQKVYSIAFKEILPPFMAEGTSELTNDGTWCWFQDPRAVYYEGSKKQTYTGWITHDGKVQVASYNHETGEVIIKSLIENFQVDDHNNPTFLVRPDGRILVAYSGHFYGPMRVLVSTNPEDISSFGPEANFGDNVTYANPYQIGDSTVMFYRDGVTWHPTMNVSLDGGVTWGTPQEFITRNGSQQRPYVKYVQDSKGGMHLTFTTGHPRNEASNKIYYVYYINKKFYKADGTFIKNYTGSADALNIDSGEPETVYDASQGKGWTWDIGLDENEQPVILYAAFPDDLNHHYYYARWNGATWQNHHLVNSGRWFPQTPEGGTEAEPNYSGGMAIDPNNINIVYVSKQVNGIFELFKYQTPDKGVSWEITPITENSPEGTINVRPVVPRGRKNGYFDVMWMRGTYVTYENFLTSVMYHSPKDQKKFFDFGPADSDVDSSAALVTENTLFNGEFGFESSDGLASVINDQNIHIVLQDDVHGTEPATFKMAMLNGHYTVTVTQGNSVQTFDELSISANGEMKVSGINIAANESKVSTFDVSVENGLLSISIEDQSATAKSWNINSLLVETQSFSASGFNIEEGETSLYEKQSIQLNFRATPSSLKDVVIEWMSKNPAVATVTNGQIKGHQPGETWIYGQVAGTHLKDSCKVQVVATEYIEQDVVFDFGTTTSPVASGAIGINETSGFNGSYGWKSVAGLLSRDRGSETSADQDFVLSTAATEFIAYLPNGNYHLTLKHGDRDYAHDAISVYANEELLYDNLNPVLGQYLVKEADVEITDGVLTLRIQDDGGSNEHWVLNSLSIVENITSDNAFLDALMADGSLIQGFQPKLFEYQFILPFGETMIPQLTARAKSSSATMVTTQATQIPGEATIVITAEDGVTTQTYTVSFDDEKNTDATLADLKVSGNTINGFKTDLLEYNFFVGSGETTVPTVEGVAADVNAAVIVTPAESIPGTTKIEVTAEDGVTLMTYLVNFTQTLSDDATLASLSISGALLSGFSPAQNDYSVELPYGTTQIPVISAVSADNNATIELTQLAQLPGTATVEVTAEDGVTILSYSVSFTVAKNSNSSLSDLLIDGVSIADFDAKKLDYQVILPYGTIVIPVVSATSSDPNAALLVTQSAELNGSATVLVTAENGVNTTIYSVSFTVAKNSDATLSDLQVDGVTVPDFGSETLEYQLTLPYGTTTIPVISGMATDSNAEILITQASALPGSGLLLVTAEDGVSTKSYQVNFSIAKNTDASLSDIKVNNVSLNSFESGIFTYSMEFPFGTTTIPVVSASATDANAQVQITQSTAVAGVASVVVTAEDGTTQQSYSINFTVAKNADASLSELKVNDVAVGGFDPKTLSYSYVLPYGTTALPVVSASATDTNAKIEITQATSLNGSASVTVTAEDGVSQKNYTISFSVAKNTDSSLSDLKAGGETVANFAAGTLTYTVILPYKTTEIPQITATSTDANATLSITQASALPGVAKVQVTAEDGTTKSTYEVIFIIAKNTDATLAEITISGALLTGFSAQTVEYLQNIIGNVVPEVTATATDENAEVAIQLPAAVPGDIVITVTAADGVSSKTYTIHLVELILSADGYSWKLFPNPVVDQLSIHGQLPIKSVIIWDLQGKQVYSEEFSNLNKNQQIEMTELPAGIYQIQLFLEGGMTKSFKLLKNK